MAEHKCLLTQSCCGCSLRSGSLAIGIILLICSILQAIGGIYNGVNGVKQGWFDMAIGVISIILCAVLIQGIRQKKPGMMMVWVWVMAIVIAINCVLGLLTIILTLNIIFGVILILFMALYIYCILVVRSYAIAVREGTDGGMA